MIVLDSEELFLLCHFRAPKGNGSAVGLSNEGHHGLGGWLGGNSWPAEAAGECFRPVLRQPPPGAEAVAAGAVARRRLVGNASAAALHLQANSYLPQRDILLLGEESKRGLLELNSSPQCGAKVDWAAMERDPGLKRAAVFTPYNLVVGGGERYLLSVVQAFQVGYRSSNRQQFA